MNVHFFRKIFCKAYWINFLFPLVSKPILHISQKLNPSAHLAWMTGEYRVSCKSTSANKLVMKEKQLRLKQRQIRRSEFYSKKKKILHTKYIYIFHSTHKLKTLYYWILTSISKENYCFKQNFLKLWLTI